MSQNKSIQSFKPFIRYNKNFVFNGKKYPIDFNLITNNSNFFYERKDEYQNEQDIELTEESFDNFEESLPSFISSCHNESFEINDSNVFPLNRLSIKYEVPSLKSLTDEFIRKYNKELIFQSIQYKYQNLGKNSNEKISLEKDEEYIASNFFDFINNDKLLELPISILYRIINNPKLDINQMNETNKNQLIDFLFKCLNKYKKKASVLFLNLDLENQRIEIFSKLINEYSDVFDFSMANPKFLMKTANDLLSELSQLKKSYSSSISQINQLFDQIQSEKQRQQELFDSFKQFAQGEIKKENEKLNELLENIKKESKNEKQRQQDLFDSFKQSAQDEIKKENEKLNELLENIKKENKNEKQRHQELFDSFKQSIHDQMMKENKEFKESFEIIKKEIQNEKQNNSENVNELKVLIGQNNNIIKSLITKDIIILF